MTSIHVDDFVVRPGQAPTQGAPANLPVGITADLIVTASDADGDPLSYQYLSSCAGSTFTPPGTGATPNVTRFHHADPDATCTISVEVSDGAGGATTASVVVTGLATPR